MFEAKYMERAIELAKKGIGAVNPNPLVGAVIVKDNRIIGEGYHERYGELHAERNAFKNLTEDAEGAEMYVTLEPCCHFGKQPPCTYAIVEHKISKVYVASDDPNEKVSGGGYAFLRENGVEVETHMMKEKADAINNVFFHYITTKTPYIVMKYGMTLDGKIATKTGKSQWITNEQSRKKVQEFRNELMGIMVGIGTVLADNPSLTCRIPGGRNPVRIVCDSKLRIPMDCKLVNTAGSVRTIVATLSDRIDDSDEKLAELFGKGVEVIFVPEKDGEIDLKALMAKLGEEKIDGILLEGGGTLNYSMLKEGLVNEIRAFVAPKLFGGATAKSPVMGPGVEEVSDAFEFKLEATEIIDNDVLLTYIRK